MEDKEFAPYQESFELKELGFDEPVEFFKDSSEQIFDMRTPEDAPCILWQKAFRFFRDKHNLRGTIMDFIDDELGVEWDYEIAVIGTDVDEKGNYKPLVDYSVDDKSRKFKTYEEAELACLKKLIEIVKNG